MKRKLLATLVVLVLVGGGLIIHHRRTTTSASTTPPSSSEAKPVVKTELAPFRNVELERDQVSPELQTQAVDRVAFIDRSAQVREVGQALNQLADLYVPVGSLQWDEAKAVIDERKAAARALRDRLAALGPGGARIMASSYHDAGNTRAKLLLIRALGKVNDPEAGTVLRTLLSESESVSLRKEMVLALGGRPESEQILVDVLVNEQDERVRFASAQALSGRSTALQALTDRLTSETSLAVRRELVHTVGLVGTVEAMDVLVGVARTPEELLLRQTAIQELGRSFGQRALLPLEGLLVDGADAIRSSAVSAVARVRTQDATALLERAAATDTSTSVRARAGALLASARHNQTTRLE